MGNEHFAAIVREPAAVIRTADQRKKFVARTTNRLLGTMDGVVGVKTGYTREAGRCLIAVVTREVKELLLVLLNARQRWGAFNRDRKSTRLNSSHVRISYAVFCLQKIKPLIQLAPP